MRPTHVITFALLVSIASFGIAEDKKPAPPTPTVAELVADLGHPVYAAREKAQRELWKRGDEAIPLLQKASASDDAEVVRRARELLDKFAWGIRPDTPAEVLKLLRQFQAGDKDPQKAAELRKTAILDLIHYGPAGLSVARALLVKPLPDDTHAQLVAQITALVRNEVPLRLFEGKTEHAAELIALHAAGTGPEGAADYAAFQIMRNDLPAAIAKAEAALEARPQSRNHKLILAHLYRGNGDWAKARAVAAAAGSDAPTAPGAPRMYELLREDAGEWGKLADEGYTQQLNHPDAARLFLLRLAGRTKEFDTEVTKVLKATNEFSSPEETREAILALFANNKANEATTILLERKQHLGLLGESLILRLRYKDALAIEPAKDLDIREKLEFDLRRGRILALTGKRDDAVQLFGKAAAQLQNPEREGDTANPLTAVRTLIRTEMRTGLRDLAAEHAAQFIVSGVFARYNYAGSGESLYEILFGQDATAAESLFTALRAKNIPGKEPGPTMMRVRDLLAGKASKAAVDEAMKALREAASQPPARDPELRGLPRGNFSEESLVKAEQSKYFLAVATVCRAANRDEDAEAAFKQAAELAADSGEVSGARSWAFGTSDAARPFVEWADFLYDRGRFQAAADTYLAGWKKFPNQPLPLFLSGKAIAKAGNLKEGERRVDLSHWVGLGQDRTRGRFLDDLVRRGEGKAAQRETALILQVCWCRDHYFGNVMNQAAKAAVLGKDFATAAQCARRSQLVMLKTPGMYYVEMSGYVNVPHEIQVYSARAALAAGKTDEAVTLAREILAITPGHLDLVSGMVPQLEKLGKKAEADELFGIAWKAYEKLLLDFPDSSSAKHALAALSANCRRELVKGLAFAQEAVKADPASVPYRETLAEVLFRSGERTKALDVMTKLTEEDTRSRLYKRQLTRYRTGEFDSPKPDSEE